MLLRTSMGSGKSINWVFTVAVLVSIVIAVAIWRTQIHSYRSFQPVPHGNRFSALVPFRRNECIEVVSRSKDRIFVDDVWFSPNEFAQKVKIAVSNDMNIKAVVLIIGVDGSTSFQSLENALISSVPKQAKLYFFHEGSSRGIQYVGEEQ